MSAHALLHFRVFKSPFYHIGTFLRGAQSWFCDQIFNPHNNSYIIRVPNATCSDFCNPDFFRINKSFSLAPSSMRLHWARFQNSTPGFTSVAQPQWQCLQDTLSGAVSTVQIHKHPHYLQLTRLLSATSSTDLPVAIAGPCLLLICQKCDYMMML